MGIDTLTARRFAEYRYSIGIAAKACNVPADPLQCELLVHQPIVAIEVAFGIYCRLRKEPQVTQAIVNCDDDYPLLHETRRVISIGAPK